VRGFEIIKVNHSKSAGTKNLFKEFSV